MQVVSNKMIDEQLNRLYESYGKLCATKGLGALLMQKVVLKQIQKFEKIKENRMKEMENDINA